MSEAVVEGTTDHITRDSDEHRERAKRVVSGIIGSAGWRLRKVYDDQGIKEVFCTWTYADVWVNPDTNQVHARCRHEEELIQSRVEPQDSTEQVGATVDEVVHMLSPTGEHVLVDLEDDQLANALEQDKLERNADGADKHSAGE